MRQILFLLCVILLLTACAPARTVSPTLGPTATLTLPAPTLTLPSSATPLSTQTPAPPTITPLPPIPTFTPTFDARTIVTVTPAAKAECVVETATNENFSLPASNPNEYGPDIGISIDNYLKKGGNITSVIKKLNQAKSSGTASFDASYRLLDLNGDGMDDLIFVELVPGDFPPRIFFCNHGSYQGIIPQPKTKYFVATDLTDVVDLNQNGIPEIIFTSTLCGGACGFTIYVFEWNGHDFQAYNEFHEYMQDLTIRDVDHNGTKEIVVLGGKSPGGGLHAYRYLPKRLKTTIYGWNGSNLAEISSQFKSPDYRFQAIQDADQFVMLGKYADAAASYQAAISNDNLEWWSLERSDYLRDSGYPFSESEFPTPYPTPIPDLTEYPRLAAYAYYRMIALHIHLGDIDAAKAQYTTLQAKFPAGSPGYPYAEMASQFWDAYQSSGKMYNACAAAIAYADAHPEILTPLGSDYHGWQSHTYTPADVCPFR